MRYILGVLGLLVVLIVAIILIATRTPSTSTQTGKKAVIVADYADKNSSVSYVVRGRITGEDSFRLVRITVKPNERSFEILSGYEEAVQDRKTFSNNGVAYTTFLKTLDKAGFSREKDTTIKDDTGVCPLSREYKYQLNDSGKNVFYLWNGTCGVKGSFGGETSTIQQLFQAQIPSYNDLVGNLSLG